MKSRFAGSIIVLIALVLVASSEVYSAPFPLNFSLDSLRKADKAPEKFVERTVAFKGHITVAKQLPDGKPYIFVKFPAPNPNNEGIWVAGFSNAKPSDLPVGHDIAVLGYFELVDPQNKEIGAIHKKAYQVTGYCIANATSQMGIYATEGTSQCLQWQNGMIPTLAVDSTRIKAVKPVIKK